MTQPLLVALVAAGEMGAGIGRRLTESGVTVLTSLAGRGEGSRRRAADAGMADASDAALARAELILSVVPPGNALAFAERMAPALAAAPRKPIFVDCNAVSPQTMQAIAAVIEPTGATLVDAGIIGTTPRPGCQPAVYASGLHAATFAERIAQGLHIKVLPGPIGQASALKLSYSALNKGLYAIGAAAIMGAVEAGVEAAFLTEIASSQPHVLAYLTKRMPAIFPKTYRWGAEMREIGQFLGGPAGQIYDGAGQLYDRLAADHAGAQTEEAALLAFLQRKPAD